MSPRRNYEDPDQPAAANEVAQAAADAFNERHHVGDTVRVHKRPRPVLREGSWKDRGRPRVIAAPAIVEGGMAFVRFEPKADDVDAARLIFVEWNDR